MPFFTTLTDVGGMPDVIERIRIQDHKVGQFTGRDGADLNIFRGGRVSEPGVPSIAAALAVVHFKICIGVSPASFMS